MLALTQLSNYLTLKCSFSAVSKPNFASKYALELAICSKRRLRKGTWGETRWKALDEIYKICILLHRSDLKISARNRQHFFANE